MPNSKFSKKDDREIKHIITSEEKRGVPAKKASSIAYGHVVNQKKGEKSSGKKG